MAHSSTPTRTIVLRSHLAAVDRAGFPMTAPFQGGDSRSLTETIDAGVGGERRGREGSAVGGPDALDGGIPYRRRRVWPVGGTSVTKTAEGSELKPAVGSRR